jgi:hypothetical protein
MIKIFRKLKNFECQIAYILELIEKIDKIKTFLTEWTLLKNNVRRFLR